MYPEFPEPEIQPSGQVPPAGYKVTEELSKRLHGRLHATEAEPGLSSPPVATTAPAPAAPDPALNVHPAIPPPSIASNIPPVLPPKPPLLKKPSSNLSLKLASPIVSAALSDVDFLSTPAASAPPQDVKDLRGRDLETFLGNKDAEILRLTRSLKEAETRLAQVSHGGTQVLQYPEDDIQASTGNFDPKVRLGADKIGEIYRARLAGRAVTVKRLLANNPTWQEAVVLAARFRHPNLLSLLGHTSLQNPRPCLVYEATPQGTLREKLDCTEESGSLPWDIRVRIAFEVSAALTFLNRPHSQLSVVAHRDPTSDGILLTASFEAKLVDFSFISASQARGFSPGNPEKTDVFAYGVVLGELLTAKKPAGLAEYITTTLLPSTTSTLEGKKGAIDPFVRDVWPQENYIALGRLMRDCLQQDLINRPSMREVCDRLRWLAVDNLPSTGICVICLTSQIDTRLQCGHSVVCSGCAQAMRRRDGCPVCGSPIPSVLMRNHRVVTS